MTATATAAVAPGELGPAMEAAVSSGQRFAGVLSGPAGGAAGDASTGGGGTRLVGVTAGAGRLAAVTTVVEGDYPAISEHVEAAWWYERDIAERFGPRALRWAPAEAGSTGAPGSDRDPAEHHVLGPEVFRVPYGPVRSGVFESVEYLLSTGGEEIVHCSVLLPKRRRAQDSFDGLTLSSGVLAAERVEGISAVAHAIAYCEAVERLAGIELRPPELLVRVLLAEIERVVNHLDVMVHLAEGAGLAVAVSRFSLYKERAHRILSMLTGSRFGRGAVVVGGARLGGGLVAGTGQSSQVAGRLGEARAGLERLVAQVLPELELLMQTPSFIDRVRGTGRVTFEEASAYGALGPVGRASGLVEDVRCSRPYAGYALLQSCPGTAGGWATGEEAAGDALARLKVRVAEVRSSFQAVFEALGLLAGEGLGGEGPARSGTGDVDGIAFGWAEASQGELLYLVEAEAGRIRSVAVRSASFHNLVLFAMSLAGDVFTDFAFNEASFGLSMAGATL
ncbi:MAG: NADH-quinone oxidoreductase subunit D-related protein [Acidimicrobiales bacterium]